MTEKVSKNEVIFEEPEVVKFLFIVKSGQIKLFKTSRDGKELF